MNKSTKVTGAIYGATAAACYGMNPLFTLPLYAANIGVNSVLCYRYVLAVILLWGWLKFFKKTSFKIDRTEFIPLLTMGLIFSFSSFTLFKSYTYMDAGIASTLLFIYPILVAILMILFFKEKIRSSTIISLILMTIGITMLYNGKPGECLNIKGVLLVFLSALSYAVYIIGIKTIPKLSNMNADKLIFYVMLFGSFIYIYNLDFFTKLEIINTPLLWLNAIALALLPTIISLAAMTESIKLIGATPAAILGALEPVTALFFGVAVFHEHLTVRIVMGIAAILTAVILIILKKDIASKQRANIQELDIE